MNSLYLLAKPMGVFSVRFFSWSFWVCLLILGDAHYTSPAEDFEWLCSLRFPATDFLYILKLETACSSSIINKARGCFHYASTALTMLQLLSQCILYSQNLLIRYHCDTDRLGNPNGYRHLRQIHYPGLVDATHPQLQHKGENFANHRCSCLTRGIMFKFEIKDTDFRANNSVFALRWKLQDICEWAIKKFTGNNDTPTYENSNSIPTDLETQMDTDTWDRYTSRYGGCDTSWWSTVTMITYNPRLTCRSCGD